MKMMVMPYYLVYQHLFVQLNPRNISKNNKKEEHKKGRGEEEDRHNNNNKNEIYGVVNKNHMEQHKL